MSCSADPRKIELEFSQTKKRPGRKRRGETGGSCFKLGAKLRRNSLAYHGSSEANPCNNEILPGSRDGRIVNCGETERRQAYMPQASIVSEESIFTTLYSSSKQLVPVSSTNINCALCTCSCIVNYSFWLLFPPLVQMII
ncbi:hypothetical protein U1Q18_005138 [Sarracenia purpurea var. burkii]